MEKHMQTESRLGKPGLFTAYGAYGAKVSQVGRNTSCNRVMSRGPFR